jgi:hypothetical protein
MANMNIEIGKWYVSKSGAVVQVTSLNRLNVISNYYEKGRTIKDNVLTKGSFRHWYSSAESHKHSVIKAILK